MFSSFLFLTFVIIVSSQSSPLWSSLLVIPVSVSIMVFMEMALKVSGLMFLLYVMIFVSGLMVLIISVSLISYSDLGFNFSKGALILLVVPSLFFVQGSVTLGESSFMSVSPWIQEELNLGLIILIFLFSVLLILSKFMLSFKGMFRLF